MIKAWDADGHVSESEVTFSDEYWDPKLKDRRPSIVETGPDGPLYWMIDTRSFPVRAGLISKPAFLSAKTASRQKSRRESVLMTPSKARKCARSKLAFEQLDRENTALQVIYPTMFLSYPITYDRDLAVAMMRAYNSWVADLTGQYPERLKWVTVIDPVDPQASVREIERGKKLGAVAVMLLGVTGDVRIDDPPMEPIWAAANDTGLPVAVHTGHSFRALGQVNDTHHDKTAISFWLTVQFAFHRVISKGIADRYPNLRIAFLEAGCSWVPALVERIEEYSGFPGARAGVDFHRGYKGKHLPKEYIERGQIYFGFEVDEKLLPFAIEEFGDQCWVYGSDIPHGDRLYGAVNVFLKRNDISEESKRKLLVDNTARFYGLEK